MAINNHFVWDAHSCISLNPKSNLSLLKTHQQSGFDYVSINIGMDMNSIEQILSVISSFRAQINASADLCLIENIRDIEQAQKNKQLAISFDLEGGVPLAKDPNRVALFKKLGVRQMHLAYNRNNELCGGCYDEDIALTSLGKKMVEAIDDAGILMDCSHTGHQSSLDIIEHSKNPVIFSHANVRQINDNHRNLTEQQIQACAGNKGVIGVNGVKRFLSDKEDYAQALCEQIDYLVQKIGADHVGIGLDYVYDKELNELPVEVDADFWWPKSHGYDNGLAHGLYAPPQTLTGLVDGLQKLGYDDLSVGKILGGNFLRIAKQVWQ